ncbi:Fat storage-inducing transmembrane protein [Scheffersomyces coipomensis]|uniref:Fat storage-inducing transmembrane protein n=1 Tax=Scheffersomyces coipomensis TaxID=1788519 RepID=UPI00315CF415
MVKGFSTKLYHDYKVSLLEVIYLSSFLINFALGKIVHLLSPDEEVYNYYNNKKNILNQLFVKKGWGWTTLFIALFYICLNYQRHNRLNFKTIQAVIIRYGLVTIWWIFFTQWCFGLPIMDKIFILTGGKCVINDKQSIPKALSHLIEFFEEIGFESEGGDLEANILKLESSIVSSYSCRRLRGSWEGGHDPSGHVFLLIHSSLYLFLEALPYWQSWTVLLDNIRAFSREVRSNNKTIQQRGIILSQFIIGNPHILIILLISLWWFMLFMTNIYFHSIAEKLVGLIFGYVGVLAIYYIPRIMSINKDNTSKKVM